MKKKTTAPASKLAKRRGSGDAAGKVATKARKRQSPVAADDATLTIRRLRAELAEARRQIEELQASANTDFLLEIPNRRGFERELDRAISYIKRYQATGALIVLDVDRLKPINDSFGHAAGDQV